MNIHLKKNHGFTMLEIIVVLLIMAIVTVIIVSKVASTSEYELKSQTDVIKSHLRYAQLLAMNSDSTWGINFPTSGTYSLFRNGDTSQTVALPGESSSPVTLPSGITITTGIVAFNDWGQPSTAASGDSVASSNISCTVSCGGASESITITRNTGYIP